MGAYTEITNENLDAVINGGKAVLIDFWASWCGPCKMLSPVVEELAAEYEGRAVVAKCNVDDCPDIAMNFQISSIPALLFFKDGELKEKAVGFRNKGMLAATLDKYL
ncbi:MAG: thioredoxin [Clostridiaceae bacterium]|jgi:thioredoxin 1|nr:thioredoxin [Clostridiaceae bacterium]